jgi:hypothetical protein
MTLPILEASPGMPAHLVVRASSAELAVSPATKRHGFVQPTGPHRFVLRCGDDAAVMVGESRFSILELCHGTVRRIHSTAQLEYLPLDAALDLADALVGRLEGVGFVASERCARSRARALTERSEHVRIAEHHAPLGSGIWRAETWLRVVVRQGGGAARALGIQEHGCLMTLVVADETPAAGGAL